MSSSNGSGWLSRFGTTSSVNSLPKNRHVYMFTSMVFKADSDECINSKLEHNRTHTLKIGNYHFALAYTTLLLLLDHSKIFHNFFSQIPGFQRKNVSIFEKFSFHLKASPFSPNYFLNAAKQFLYLLQNPDNNAESRFLNIREKTCNKKKKVKNSK